MLRAFLGTVIQGVALANFTAFVNNLSALCYQAYCNPNPQARLATLQTIDAQVRGAFASVPLYQHDQLASDIMSALASFPFSADQLRRLGPQECSRHFPIFAPVVNAISNVLSPYQYFDGGSYMGNNQPPQPAPLPRLLEQPGIDTRPQGWNIGAMGPRLLGSPFEASPPSPRRPPERSASDEIPRADHQEPAGVDNTLVAPSGLSRETRKIGRLQDTNRAAYSCAVVKLEQAHRDDSEGVSAREWIKKFVQLPLWEADSPSLSRSAAQQKDKLREARNALDNAVAGHEEAKGILLDRYAMWLRNPDGPGMVLGIQGPPGNGKTTLAERGLSSALGRPSETIDMGGIGDAQILRGDRGLWRGAPHGKVADCLMRAGTRRLILILEEVDKVTRSGVQHVLSNLTDPSRNFSFEDSYFSGVPLDLSKAMIVCTFNETSCLDSALVSRMGRIIETSALSHDDKVDIAQRFLIPKALEDVRRRGAVTFDHRAVCRMVELCAGDPGARGLKSNVERVVGAVNTAMIEGELDRYYVTEADIRRTCVGARSIWHLDKPQDDFPGILV